MSTTHDHYIANLYNTRSTAYSTTSNDSWHPSFAHTLLTTALKSSLPLPSQNPILLDLACGTGLVSLGALSHHLLPQTAHIIGVDLSPGMLSVARARLAQLPVTEQSRVQLLEHSMLSLRTHPILSPLKGKVDIITCASAFVLLPDAQTRTAALNEWAAMLKPGTGRLVFDVTHEHNLRAGLVMEAVGKRLGLRTPGERGWITREDAVRELVEGCEGLEEQSIEVVAQTGEGTVRLSAGREVAITKFERMIGTGAYSEFKGAREGEAREAFVEEWEQAKGEDGLVEVVDGVYVIVARRKA